MDGKWGSNILNTHLNIISMTHLSRFITILHYLNAEKVETCTEGLRMFTHCRDSVVGVIQSATSKGDWFLQVERDSIPRGRNASHRAKRMSLPLAHLTGISLRFRRRSDYRKQLQIRIPIRSDNG